MSQPPQTPPPVDSVILLALLGLLLFASPLRQWWSGPASPWYLPYLLWLALIALGGWLFRRHDRHEL